MMKFIYSNVDYKKVELFYNNGMEDKRIAEKVGCTVQNIVIWRNNRGLPSQRQKKIIKFIEDNQLVVTNRRDIYSVAINKMLNDNVSETEIMRVLGVSKTVIWKIKTKKLC